MKTVTTIFTALGCLICVSCQTSPPAVPNNGRVVVEPQGTTGNVKSWNTIQRAEGDAQLGPLSNMRR